MTAKTVKKIAQRSLAGFMALWLSGVVFLLCCQTMNANAMAAESCPLAKLSEHCDKAKKATEITSVVGLNQENSVDCCAFLPAVFDKARKIEQTQKQMAITPKSIAVRFKLQRPSNSSPTFPAFQSRVPDRHGTFIKNCVFRI